MNNDISLRDYFAGQAIAHMNLRPYTELKGEKWEIDWQQLDAEQINESCGQCAVNAYRMADAMLQAREARP